MPVYDADQRVEYFNVPAGRQPSCDAVGALVYAHRLTLNPDGMTYAINYNEMETLETIVKDAAHPTPPTIDRTSLRFAIQKSIGFATAFVVGPRMIVTAGHSLWDDKAARTAFEGQSLRDKRFVLGYHQQPTHISAVGTKPTAIPVGNVFQLDRIRYMSSMMALQPGLPDFAIISLVQAVSAAIAPLQFSATRVQGNTPVWHAGHPEGLPLKSGQGTTRAEHTPDNQIRLRHNLTIFPGDSGAPIFDGTNQVVGIHVRGPTNGANQPDYGPIPGGYGCPVYSTASLATEDQWCEAIRTDYFRWFFDVNAHTKLRLSFLDRPNIDAYQQPCGLRVAVRLHYPPGGVEPVHVIGTTELGQGYTQNLEINLHPLLQHLAVIPVDVTGINFQLVLPAGAAGNTTARRILSSMTLHISSPNVNREWMDVTKKFDQTNNNNDVAAGYLSNVVIEPSFDRVLRELIYM